MTDEREKIEATAVEDVMPAPRRKSGRKKTGSKGNHRFRSGVTPSPGRKLVWLDAARVIDLEAFKRLRERDGLGAKRIARALSTTVATAQKLMSGRHWQQDAEKVRIFNKAKGGSIDPETGVPTAADLAKFGGAYKQPLASDSQGEKDLREIVASTGVAAANVDEALRGLRILAGAAETGDLPGKVDTKWLQDQIDVKLGTILTVLDPVRLAGASTADLSRLAGMLFEKRALLRGEPTAIVRNEQRGGLDKLAQLLLAEAQRRGITVDLAPGPGGYQEVMG